MIPTNHTKKKYIKKILVYQCYIWQRYFEFREEKEINMGDLKHLSGNNWSTCVFFHACVHVCVQCIDLCVHAGARANVCCGVGHVMTRGKWPVSPLSVLFISLLLSVNLRLTDLARLTDQWVSMICLFLLPSGGVAHAIVFRFYVGAGDTNQFFMSMWQALYQMNHLPSLLHYFWWYTLMSCKSYLKLWL